jgi:hypothetical protein
MNKKAFWFGLFIFLASAFYLAPKAAAFEGHSLLNSLKPFYTDGCTLFIDGPSSKPGLWRHCCVEHDLRYWFGGDRDDAHQANLQLGACVKSVAGTLWGQIIYRGVEMGRYSPVKHPTHWGWGWEMARGSGKLDHDESVYVIEQLRKTSVDQILVEEFIHRNFPGI